MDGIRHHKKKKKNFRKMKCQKKDRKADMIEVLAARLELSKSDVNLAYETFKKKYPDGEIPKFEFLEENKVKSFK